MSDPENEASYLKTRRENYGDYWDRFDAVVDTFIVHSKANHSEYRTRLAVAYRAIMPDNDAAHIRILKATT